MYTQCPSCATVFVVTSEELQLAEGEARCGLCSEVFQAVDSLAHELPAPRPDAFEAEEAPSPAEPMPAPPARPAAEGAARAAVDWMERVLGLEGESSEGVRPRRQWPRVLAVMALVLLALLQYGHFNSTRLAREATWRPFISSLCAVTGCPVPARRAPERMAIADRTVRAHPDVQGALEVDAVLVNRAPFAQPLPQVRLTLRALNGEVVGARWFVPEQYLAAGQPGLAGADAVLPPEATARLHLEVREPAQGAAGFEFAFR